MRVPRTLAEPMAILVATRVALACVAWVGQVLLPIWPAASAWLAFPRRLVLDGWVRWDSGWHLLVAQQGYRFDPAAPGATPTVLPLFPLIIRAASLALGNLPAAGLAVANLAFAAAVLLHYRLLQRRFGSPVAARATLLLCVFPFGFVFEAAYSESLTLLLAVATFLLLESGRPFAAGALAALAGLSSPVGLALWPALAIWQAQRWRSRPRRELLALATPPLAIGAFAAWLRHGVGEPPELVLVTLTGATGHGLFRDGLAWLGPIPGGNLAPALGLVLGLAALVSVVPAVRSLGAPYAAFALGAVALPALAGADALGRALVVAFPVFAVLARYLEQPLAESLVVVASSLALGALAVLFATWYPVDRAATPVAPARALVAPVVPSAARRAADVAHPLDLELRNELLVLGYDLPGTRVAPGQSVSVRVTLQALRPAGVRRVLSVHLNDPTGRTRASSDYLLDTSALPGAAPAGDVGEARLELPLPSDAPPGVYTPELLLFEYPSFERLPLVSAATGREAPSALAEVVVLRPEDTPDPGSLRAQHATDAVLEGQIALRGFDLSSSEVSPGEGLAVTLYWQAVAPPIANYTAFVQLLGEDGKLVAQSDAYPVEGRYPTSKWRVGEVVRDVHRVAVPPTATGRSLRLIAGMYRFETMRRLDVADAAGRPAGDFVELGAVGIRRD